MATAIWNDITIAQSDATVMVEGNHYFPLESVDQTLLKPSDKHTTCPWKGEASYFSIEADGQTNTDAAWYYPEPKEAASEIAGHVAFWNGVTVLD